MKRKLYILAVLATMILCAACTQNAEATKAEKLWDGEKVQLSADGQSIELSQDLIAWFYNYNNDNWAEMAYLPEFAADRVPDWDDLTRYVYYMYEKDHHLAKKISEEDFRETVQKYLPEVSFTDAPSMYLDYQDGYYTVKGFDFSGSNSFRLNSLSLVQEDVYLAEFTVLHLAEAETAETENPTPNARAIHEFAAKEGLDPADERQILKNILVREDYGDILEMTYNLTAEFRLTGDKDAPFQYLSCHRQYPDGEEYDLKDM